MLKYYKKHKKMLLNFLEDILFYYLKLDRIKTINSTSTSKSSIIYSLQIIYSLYQAKEIAKKSIQQRNEFNKVIKLNVYYIYEFLKFLEVFVFTIQNTKMSYTKNKFKISGLT